MKNKAYNLRGYSFSNGEEILVDANVWLYLFPPTGGSSYSWAKNYSSAFKQLIGASAKPVLSPIVLSEYINRYCRIEWEGGYKATYPKFKDFRNSSDFKTIASTCKTFAKNIVGLCTSYSVPYSASDMNQALDEFENGTVDFNDALLVSICQDQNCKLLTNDGDFVDGGIDVLTSNPKLLRACP